MENRLFPQNKKCETLFIILQNNTKDIFFTKNEHRNLKFLIISKNRSQSQFTKHVRVEWAIKTIILSEWFAKTHTSIGNS